MLRSEAETEQPADAGAPTQQATRSAAASRRMDDAFREFLAERGSKSTPLSEITRLVSGVTALRLSADAVLDLWERDDDRGSGDRATARIELLRRVEQVRDWYDDLAESLDGEHPVPASLDRDSDADRRLVRCRVYDLRDEDGKATATAVRMIWTGDHLDAVRRLQPGPGRPGAGRPRHEPRVAPAGRAVRNMPEMLGTDIHSCPGTRP